VGKSAGAVPPDAYPIPGAREIHPRGLLEALSYIDQNFANELGGCIISKRFFNIQQQLEFMEVGFRSSFISGVISVILTPIAIGVLEKYIPMFGENKPNVVDQFSALLLALSFYIGYALFIAKSARNYIGEYTKSMVHNLLVGMSIGAALKAILAYIVFQTCYFYIATESHIFWASQQLYHARIKPESIARFYYWLVGFRSVFLTSAIFVVLTTVIFTAIPWGAYLWAKKRNKRLIAAGTIKSDPNSL
jgi:hypothetical protein